MSEPRRSRRFNPNAITERIVPILLVILLLTLAGVLIIVGMTLVLPS